MKKLYPFLIYLFLFSYHTNAQSEQAIKFTNGNFYPEQNILRNSFSDTILRTSLFNNRYYLLVQFSKTPSAPDQQKIKAAGLMLEQYIPDNGWFASAEVGINFRDFKNLALSAVSPIPVSQKLDKTLYSDLHKLSDAIHVIAITFIPSVGKKQVQEIFRSEGIVAINEKFHLSNVIYVKASAAQLSKIAALPFITFISIQLLQDHPINYFNRAAHGVAALSYSGAGGRNLQGQGVTIGVGDNADISTHIDFSGRLINRTPWYVNAHGTHTSGTTAGGGILDQRAKGMAPRAGLVSAFYSDIIANAEFYFTDYNLNLTNNSYHSAETDCSGNGQYNVLSNYVDEELQKNKKLLHVFASGNDGSYTCAQFPNSYGTVKSGWQSAKNVLTVGATDNFNNIIAYFSSRGPLKDGRLKPEIVAGGWAISSTLPNNSYGLNYGTSMAAPTVTGALALLTQRYKQLNSNALPNNALLKALVCNTAEDMGAPGPDYTFGFGSLNIRRAVEATESARYFIGAVGNSGTNIHTIVIPPGSEQVKVMLVWTDKEAAVNAATALVNDLDVTVTDPVTLVVHPPMVLNPSPSSVTNAAVEGADHLNNIEQVIINNPAAGIYPISVNGFSVPTGTQEYALTYEVVMPGVTVEYPFGGETMINNEAENIRWSAYGNNNDNFTVDYSDDNGATWNVISSSVPATSRSYSWTVPTGLYTTEGLVRVTRNGTVYSGTSAHNFAIVGRPVLTTTNLCEGTVQLNWNQQQDATSYEIMKLDGDTMKSVGTTSSLSYTVTGLQPSGTYWFAVRAVIGTTAGRSSIAVKVTPNGGACTLSDFDNDISTVAITSPSTGRYGTSSASKVSQPIQIIIKNLDDVASTGSVNVSYSINGGIVVTELISPTIAAGGTYTHTFSQHVLPAGPAVYSIKAWAARTGDNQPKNDTAAIVVKLLDNPALTLPYLQDFESAANAEYTKSTLGLEALDNFDFYSNTNRGRARTFVNSGIAYSGKKAITLDQSPFSTSSNTDSLLMTANLSNYTLVYDQLRLDFVYRNHGQQNMPGNKVWIRGSENDSWVLAYDLFAHQRDIGEFRAAKGLNINDILSNATPPQSVSSSFQVKFGEQGFTSANSPAAVTDLDDGYTFDDIRLNKAENDIALTEIISPSASGCGLTNSNPVQVKIRNYNNFIINNISANYRINGGPIISEIVPQINPKDSLIFTFATTANLAIFGEYNIESWVSYTADSYKANDSINDFVIHSSPLISSFPYLETFEAGNGNWYSKGVNSSWEWGAPVKSVISKAANGSKAWVTSTSGKYNDNENSYLYSPCFDLHTMVQPMLSFSHIYKIEDNCDCDYHWVEFSVDGGINWQKLGVSAAGVNWYNNSTKQAWQTSQAKWHVASIDVPTTSSTVRFRFVLQSDGGTSAEGVGIDDIHIFDKSSIYSGPSITLPGQNVNGNSWINFTSSGNKIFSINPNGQNLGLTNVEVFINSGAVTTKFNEYHLDRNLVVKPSVQPASPVSVRYYFTDTEAERLITATGCSTCTTIKDAYDAAVLKYNGPASEENGTLNDNFSGTYNLILPSNVAIVPYSNGYYAEFNVNNFSEFWINDGNPQFTPLPVNLIDFIALKQAEKSKLTWTTSQEINLSRFVVERGSDGIIFSELSDVTATGNNQVQTSYSFIDNSPLKGDNFYRLKMINNDNTFKYSGIRKLNFRINTQLNIYPNPVTGRILHVESNSLINLVELFDMAGKRIQTFITNGNNIALNIEDVPAGVYQLKIYTDDEIYFRKITK